MQRQGADGSVEEGDVVLGEGSTLGRELAAHGVDDGVRELFAAGGVLAGCSTGEDAAEVFAGRKTLAAWAGGLVAAGTETAGEFQEEEDEAEDLEVGGVSGEGDGFDAAGDVPRGGVDGGAGVNAVLPFFDVGKLAQSGQAVGDEDIKWVDF